MMKIRAHILFLILLSIPLLTEAHPADTLTVKILGTAEDARFDPVIIQVEPGDVIRFEVIDGLHTVTAYHPDNRRPLRIPNTATLLIPVCSQPDKHGF
ncbi:MAG: hypothetical protein U5K71_00660 [Gracilimonas sp.]|nr:hypothetical protein [Gracilimonas sp.]